MSEYGIATSGNPDRHRCETSTQRDLRVTDKIVPPDSSDPSLTLHVKGFHVFHVIFIFFHPSSGDILDRSLIMKDTVVQILQQ